MKDLIFLLKEPQGQSNSYSIREFKYIRISLKYEN